MNEIAARLSADVVVVGAGPAGMAATAAALRHGATVAVLEVGNRIGGNAVRSNGYLAFVEDEPEAFVADAFRAFALAAKRYGLVWDPSAVRQFAADSADTHRILAGRGVRFSRTVPRPEHSVERIHAVEEPEMFARAYADDFANPAVTTVFGVRAERLLVEGGRVVGVSAQRLDDGTHLYARATRGVVLATGGYQAGHLLRQRYQPARDAQSPYYGTSNCRGDGHVMGAALGADLVNMTYLPPTVLAASTVVENAIAVNTAGVRFHDEAGSFDDRISALRAQDGRRAWYILDAVTAEAQAHLIEQMPQPPLRADSLTELAAALGIPAGALEATAEQWNTFLASGAQADHLGRRAVPQDRRGLRQGPFTAVPMVEGVNISCGGFRTTPRMQVIDVLGRAVAGLFAAGDTTAGLNAAAAMCGLHISGAFTQGRVAGRAVAQAKPDLADYGSVRSGSSVIAEAEAIKDLAAL